MKANSCTVAISERAFYGMKARGIKNLSDFVDKLIIDYLEGERKK
jgi:hypothetical protein